MSEQKVTPDPLSVPVSGPLSVTPLYAAGDTIVLWDGSSWNELPSGGSAGPINVTGDVLGSGTGTVPTTVLGLQRRPVSSALPLDGQVLGWSAGQWRPVPAATVTGGGGPPGGATGTIQLNAGGGNFGGITMGGDATLNYSTGALSLAPMPGLAAGTYQGITFDAKGRATTALNMNYAPLADPHFTGVPTAPTAAPGTFSTQLATTAYVDSLYSPGAYIDTNGVLVTLSDGVSVNLCQVGLPAGDWIIDGSAYFNTGTALNYNFMLGANTTSATLPSIPYYTQLSPAGSVAGGTWTLNIPERKFTLAVPTTVYLVVRASFGAGSTVTAQGHIAAQQMQKLVTGGGGGGGGMTALTGDVTGSGTGSVATTVARLQGRNMASALPVAGQVLGWDGAQWLPTAPVTGGTGITSITFASPLTGGTITTPGQTVGLGQVPVGLLGGGTGATSSTYLRGDMTWQPVSGSVTSVGLTMPGTIFGVSGSPVTTSGTLAVTVTGASGAIPFFATTGSLGASNTLTANSIMFGGGAGTAPFTSIGLGTTGQVLTSNGPSGTPSWAPATGAGGAPGGAVNNAQYYATSTTFGGSTGLMLSATAVTGLNVGGDLTGDTYYRSASGFTRLAAGTVNYVLTSGGAGVAPSWQVAPGAGGGITGTATNNQLAVGTGSSSLGPLGTLGTTTTLLHGNAAGLPTWGPIVTADITNANITYAKMANVAAWSVMGNATVAAAAPADVTMTGTAAVTRVVSSTSAAKTSGNLANWDANGNLIDAGAALSAYLTTATAATTYAPLAGATFIGKVNTPASIAGSAYLNLPHGVAPTAPVNGDLWTTSAGGLYARINNVTVGPFGAGGGTVTSVTLSSPGGVFAVSGTNPIATTGTFGYTTTGTAGGMPYFSTTAILSSSGALTNNQLILGGGAAGPSSLALGTATQVLHGGGPPTWGAVSLTTDVGGVLQAAQEPAHTGDVTNTAGSLALTIAGNAVTYAKMQAMTANRLLGSGLSGTAVAEVVLGTNLSFTGTTLNAATGGGGGVGTSVINRVPYYDTTTTVAGNPAITSTTAGSLMINRNAAAAPGVFTATTALQVNFADNDVGGIELDTHGAVSPTFVMRHAKGTGAQAIAPNAACQTLAADVLGLYQWRGYEATTPGYSAGVARMQAVAIDNFTSTVRGTQIEFSVAPVGGTALTTQATIATGVLIGAPTAAATPAVGDLNAVRLLQGGLPLTALGATLGAPSLSWIVGASPNGAVLFVADRACTVATARAVIVTTGNAGSTLTLKKNNATTLNSTAFALDGATGAAVITLSTTATLAAGDYINITTSGTVTTGAGNVTVYVS